MTDTTLLQGEIDGTPGTSDMDVELLLELLLKSLLEEQRPESRK